MGPGGASRKRHGGDALTSRGFRQKLMLTSVGLLGSRCFSIGVTSSSNMIRRSLSYMYMYMNHQKNICDPN